MILISNWKVFFEVNPLRLCPRLVNGLKSISEWMQCLIATFPHILQSIAKYRIMWEQDARGDNQQSNSIRIVQHKIAEWISIGFPLLIKTTEIIHGSLSATKQWWSSMKLVKLLTGYHMHVHSQDMMQTVANLAGSLSFLRRLSDEWWEVLRSTVSSSGNNRQRASPTVGSTSWVITDRSLLPSILLTMSPH